MNGISDRAAHYLREELLKRERFIVVAVDAEQQVLSVHGSTSDWRLAGLKRGSEMPGFLRPLLDAAQGTEEAVVFPYVSVGDHVIDVHVLGEGEVTELVLHDVTEAHDKEQTLQQRAHEISMLSERQAMLNAELTELNQELALRRRQAEKASKAKSRFIASMSHEFRSPITSIMGYADLLSAELPDSGNPRAIQRASWHLLTLVENLLEQAREGKADVPLNPTRFSIDQLISDLEALFRPQADAKGLELRLGSEPADIEIELDELRLRQVLINLLSNAVRYTAQGRIDVRARHGDGRLNITVSDTGQGIAPADIERIFEAFTRVGDGAVSGAGLGLTISRQLVRRMGGRLDVDSEPGKGSEFRISVPCPRISEQRTETVPMSGKVLWVDDDPDVLSLYQVLLEDWGLQVFAASGVAQALEVMSAHRCPVVVTDLHLTDGDGLGLMAQLRADWPDIVGIVISGSGVAELAPQVMGDGIRAFLQKPVDLDALRLEIAAAFEGAPAGHAV